MPRDELIEEAQTIIRWVADDLARGREEGVEREPLEAKAKRELTRLLFKLTVSPLVEAMEEEKIPWDVPSKLYRTLARLTNPSTTLGVGEIWELRRLSHLSKAALAEDFATTARQRFVQEQNRG